MSRLYGLFADLRGRSVLVVGGGKVAERKVVSLLEAGARVTLGAPQLTLRLADWAHEGIIRHVAGRFADAWLDDCWFVIAATDDHRLNQRIARAAETRRLFINVVDDMALCSFHVPAIVDRGPLQVAISTAGAAPALGRRLRADIEKNLDESVAALIALVGRFRSQIKVRFPSMSARRRFYEKLPESKVANCLRRQDEQGAEQALHHALTTTSTPTTGHVTLLGAGPGDPGLLTLHGLRALQTADVIVHDRLVSDAILDRARRDADLIDVGKRPGSHRKSQDEINELLVRLAASGQHVVRLKGGDPFIFGRGGEELEYLRARGIDYEVVPGITAASACASYAGIPLTHRDHAQSVRFVTAHCQRSLDNLDWPALAQERQTLAVYMGVSQLPRLQELLLMHGRAANTPFAIIEKGSTPQQRVVTGTLNNLSSLAEHHDIAAPAILILGEVAQLGDKLAWYGSHLRQTAAPALATGKQQRTGRTTSAPAMEA